jgi:hypothetical protein
MIDLDYVLHDDASSPDLIAADNVVLRYYAFLGDIVFRAGGCDFSTDWGWVPVVDFAASMMQVSVALLASDVSPSVFEFTESGATIVFSPCGSTARVSASYVHCVADIDLAEFARCASEFSRGMYQRLTAERSDLRTNASLRSLLLGTEKGINPDKSS